MKKLSALLIFCSLELFAQQSRIELKTIYSPTLGITKNYNIYLPEGYDQSTDRYPVVYLFRGHEREWANGYEDDSRGGRNIKNVADALVSAGSMGKMILVMPGLSSTDNVVPALAVNFKNVSLASSKDGLGTGQFEDYMVKELIPYIDQNYRTIPTRWHRGVDGFSLGGYTSMNLATKHPDMFASAGGYDGTLMWLDFDDPSSSNPNDDMYLTDSMFDPLFGKPRDIPYAKRYNPANNIAYASPAALTQLKRIRFMLHSGATGASNRTVTQHVVDLLAVKGIVNEFADIRLTPTAIHNWYNADLHAGVTLPLHWKKFQSAPSMIDIHFTSPVLSAKLADTVTVGWSRGIADSALTILSLSSDAGESWTTLRSSITRDSTYQWNTTLLKDGTRYKLRLMISGSDTLFGLLETPLLTINNPGNGLPDVVLDASVKRDTLRGMYDLRWTASDPEGDSIRVGIALSCDNGVTWETAASDLPNTGVYHLNTVLAPNGASLVLKLTCFDGTGSTAVTASPIVIQNNRKYFPAGTFTHISGWGDGAVKAAIVDEARLTKGGYRISFRTSAGSLQYAVRESVSGRILCENIPVPPTENEGPLFDGIRLSIRNYDRPTASDDSSRWISGSSTLRSNTSPTDLVLGADTLKGLRSPFDYEIRLYDHTVDTSSDYQGAIPVPIKFTIVRKQDGRRVKAAFNDFDGNGTISAYDELYFLEPKEDGSSQLTWYVFFTKGTPDIAPQPGDNYLIRVLKPYTEQDTILFTPITTDVAEVSLQEVPSGFALHQNYPNPFNPATTIRYDLPAHSAVTLELFSLLGQKVKTLFSGKQETGAHQVRLDGSNLPTGVYFLRMDAFSSGLSPYHSVRKLILLK
ncbi:MAG: alpha/beta hydrolase-fold protein [Ignavibacteriales bacterium]|nr:alpha/beta hydrolase-fold protein [Ignavibacteriales bacterium]